LNIREIKREKEGRYERAGRQAKSVSRSLRGNKGRKGICIARGLILGAKN